MIDFLFIARRTGKHGVIEIYPKLIIKHSKDLMIRGGDFYAIWLQERGLWSTDEQDALQLIDRELDNYADAHKADFDNYRVLHMWDAESGMIDIWHRYCQRQMRDSFVMLDEKLIFSNTDVKKEDYASKRLPYPLEQGSIKAWNELMSVLYSGDASKLSRIYDEHIEVKVFSGKSSLRRKLSKCNDIPVAPISSGLPMKGEKMVSTDRVQSEKALRVLIMRNLNKEIHPYTKPSIDFIYKILEDAYNSDLTYDVDDMRNSILGFAASSTNQADACLKIVSKMHFKSKEPTAVVTYEAPIVFFDCEVFPNLLLVNWKFQSTPDKEEPTVYRLINPSADDIAKLAQYRLIGFNNRKYDNHILYARMIGWSVEAIYNLSQQIINEHTGFFGEAYNFSYTDIYDFSAKKQSLKKFEIELGIHHQELGLPWDQPVPEEKWEEVAQYCDNDVLATEAVFNARHADFVAREILADVAGMTVNDTTNSLTTRIIFGKEKSPRLVYTDLATGESDDLIEVEPDILTKNTYLNAFPGYEWVKGEDGRMHNMFRGTDLGLGGYVYAEPGMYWNVALLDVASLHPHSAVALNYFGEYTKNFNDLMDVRIYVKHKEYDKAKKLFNGKLAKYLDDPKQAKALSQALKIAINSVYGLTSATFENPFRNRKNANNIVALRGALFMRTLQDEVQQRGFAVVHIKTDSIKIPDATPEIIDFCMKFAEKYGYTFEHEATYEKMCLVNDAVYIARYLDADQCQAQYGYMPEKNEEHSREWTATGTQFQIPYVFKTLFSHEPVVFADLCQTKTVSKGAIYLDKNEDLPEGEHKYIFVGRVGSFCPIKPGCGGAVLLRESGVNDAGEKTYAAVGGSKGYRWLESEMVHELQMEKDIDRSYFDKMADDAADAIAKYGDYELFVADDAGMPPWQKPDMPWDDVQDEAARNFEVR